MKTKMAEDRDVVRITYKDLEEIVQRNKLNTGIAPKEGDASKNTSKEKKSKRPERCIYRPGMSRLRKTCDAHDENDNTIQETCTPDTCPDTGGTKAISLGPLEAGVADLTLQRSERVDANQNCNVENTQTVGADNKIRRRRPDIQIYVPKGKLQEQDGEDRFGSTETGGVEEEEEQGEGETMQADILPNEEMLSPNSLQHRKVDIVKSDEQKMCITFVNEAITSPKAKESTSSFVKTMIFERGGAGIPCTEKVNPSSRHSPSLPRWKPDRRQEEQSDSYLKNLYSSGSHGKADSCNSKGGKSGGLNDFSRREGKSSDQSAVPTGLDSPGKANSKRYSSMSKRKQKNGNGNGNGKGVYNSSEDMESAGVIEDIESAAVIEDIEQITPQVLDWNEEVERELALEEKEEKSVEKPLSDYAPQRGKNNQHGKRGEKSKQQQHGHATDDYMKVGSLKSDGMSTVSRKEKDERQPRSGESRRSSFDGALSQNRDIYGRADSDADSDIVDGKERTRKQRKCRERKRTTSGPSHSDNRITGSLKVTLDRRSARQVEIGQSRESGKNFAGSYGSRERLSSDSNIHSPKGGGILHISSTSQDMNAHHGQNHDSDRKQHQPAPHHPAPHRRENKRSGSSRVRASARGGAQRTLFDPSNPSKPIVISGSGAKLQFKEANTPSPPGLYDSYGQPYLSNYFSDYKRSYESHYHEYKPAESSSVDPYYYNYPGPFKESSSFYDDTYAKDPYYHSGYDPDYVIGGMSRAQCRAMAEHLLRECMPMDSQLSNLLSRRLHTDSIPMLTQLRQDLKTKYEQVILLDPDLSNRHNVEQVLWKNIFYQPIEIYRRHLGEEREDETKSSLTALLDEATLFYESLQGKLQHTYGFRLDMFLDWTCPSPENLSRTVKLALLSAQRTMICLGDVARYREQANDSANYGKARSWYMKAQQIAPKNGRPYNQLAILALYTKRKLDAVYFYMRSLAASNPFLTARESLMSLFDEARKKVEATEQKRHEEREKLKSWRRRRQKEGPRIEVWISADGHSEEGELEENYEEDLQKLSPVELNKRLSLSFLNAHGKLFAKIGMETFDEVCVQLMVEFQAVLSRSPCIISNTRLLQLMAMTMFAVDNTALKGATIAKNCRSLLQEHAVQQGLDLFAILASRFSSLLREHMTSKDYPGHLFSEDLHLLAPSIKVWSDWMLCHSAHWNPSPVLNNPDNSFQIDVWKVTADMFNTLKEVDISHVKLYREMKEGCDPVILEEDSTLAGFVPLLSAPSEPVFVHATVEKHIAKDCLRIQKLQTFGDYLCGIEPPMLAYNVETKKYYSVAPSMTYSDEDKESKDTGMSSEGEDVIVESEEEVDHDEDLEEGQQMRELRAKKEELQKKVQQRTKQKENVQAILEKHRHRTIELQIHPVFLIPDTNCFIDFLPGLKKLLYSKKYSIIVPLVVINELDGLAKGSSDSHRDVVHGHHVTQVTNRAKMAIQLLENEFEKRNTHLRALTSKGSTLDTISFRSEDTDGSGINDDLILSCCLHYCRDIAREFMPKTKDRPIQLWREVVLLTDDRNLRLKAHTRNVPVKDVPSFLKWSKVT